MASELRTVYHWQSSIDANRGPTVLRMGLGLQLRRLRERSDTTREVAGASIRASAAKISRIELGRVGLKERDVADLLTLYGVVDTVERAQFLDLVKQAGSPGWWHQYGDLLPSWFETFLGLEQASTLIRTYECQFVPGLLQTGDYAREVVRLEHSDPREVERRVALRMRRQEMLDGPDAPMLWAVVDQAALSRPLASAELCRSQLAHLIDMTERPNIRLQVIPFEHGGHPATGGAFTILRFAEIDLPDIVYTEQLTSALYLDKRSDVEHYVSIMDRLCAQIVPPDRTRSLLLELRASL